MKNLLLRSCSGLIFILIVAGGILYSPYSFLIVFGAVVVLSLWEFYRLINNGKTITVRIPLNCLGGLFFFAATFMYASGMMGIVVFFPYLFYIIYSFVSELYLKQENPLNNWAYSFLGQIYITLPISILNFLIFKQSGGGMATYSPILVMALFVFIWMNDTGAYLVGVSLGKHRLFERISPKKSWEGFVGGLIFAVASSFLFFYYVPEVSLIHWICMALVTSVFATWGDLTESLLKRTLGVKDSGSIIPGHGGMLDRFDSVFLAAPAVCLFEVLFRI